MHTRRVTSTQKSAGPDRIVRYGDHPDQHIAVRTPSATPRWTAVLVHGGYWRSPYKLDLMDPMANSLSSHSVATWNVEYRRPDEHGWAATTADLAAALRAVEVSTPIVVIGHSAGGQLALRGVADMPDGSRPALAVSLAGVIDLERADEFDMGDGAVANALGRHWSGDSPDDVASSPRHRLPLGIPQIIACGLDDDPHLLDFSRDYSAAALAAGDAVTEIHSAGDHFDIIDPVAPLWAEVLAGIELALGSGRVDG
ncbi:hypothetical protein GCM10009619_06380 [Williamsia maris]